MAAASPLPSRRRRLTEVLLLAAILVGANLLAARHYRRWDLTPTQVFALSPRTEELLRGLEKPVKILVFLVPRGEDKSLLYPYVRELCARLAAVSPKVEVELPDLDRDPERLRKVAARYGVSAQDLADGAIVLDVGGRSKFLVQRDLGELDWGQPSGPRLRSFFAEQSIVKALLELTEGHGEASLHAYEVGGAADLKEALVRDHYEVRTLEHGALPDERCDVLVLLGPSERVDARFAEAISRQLEAGRKVLVLLGPTLDEKALRFFPLGLEETLAAWGAELPQAVLVDEPRLPGNALGFVVTDGYRDHPIARGLVGRRTIWADVRPVVGRPRPGIALAPIILSTERGFGLTRPEALVAAGAGLVADPARDLPGPLPLGLAIERTEGTGKGARLVVWGSVEQILNRQLSTAHRDLFLSSLGWLVDSAPRIQIGARTPERYELRLTDRDRYRVFGVAVLGLPLFALLCALAIAYLRR